MRIATMMHLVQTGEDFWGASVTLLHDRGIIRPSPSFYCLGEVCFGSDSDFRCTAAFPSGPDILIGS